MKFGCYTTFPSGNIPGLMLNQEPLRVSFLAIEHLIFNAYPVDMLEVVKD